MSVIQSTGRAVAAEPMISGSNFQMHFLVLLVCLILGLKSASQAIFESADSTFETFACALTACAVAYAVSTVSYSADCSVSSKGKYEDKNALDSIPTASRCAARKGRTHNFSAGPSCLFEEVLDVAQGEFKNYKNLGMSFMEISHRDAGGPVHQMLDSLVANIRDLLKVPDNYHVLFFQGGAHAQFSAVPLNLIGNDKERPKADFVDTGVWSKKAMKEHSKWCDINVVYDAAEDGETTIRPVSEWKFSKDAKYVHSCTNETMSGLEFLEDPDVGDRILIADMTSTLLSRPVDISKYGVIFASSGKNLGPAGATCVIVRDDLLDRSRDDCPGIINYKNQATSVPIPNIYNTPPTYVLYLINLTCEHIKKTYGSLEAVEKRAIIRASKIYDAIDNSDGFYSNGVDKKYRSRMNCPFRIKGGDRALEALFTKESHEQGLEQLFGHPLMGGNRITIYNAIHDESIDLVVKFMKDFAQKYR